MKSLAGIEGRKCFVVPSLVGEYNAGVESVCKLLNHLVVIDTGSAAEKVRGRSLERLSVDLRRSSVAMVVRVGPFGLSMEMPVDGSLPDEDETFDSCSIGVNVVPGCP